jgi:plasmid stability protein
MATLYVENIPDDLYAALRKQAKLRRKSIAQEVISLLEAHVSTPAELERRHQLLQKALRMSARRASVIGPFPSTEEMLREDRAR